MQTVPTDTPNRQILIRELPVGALTPAHFTPRLGTVPTPGPGEVLIRTLVLSVDAANRAWMQRATYRPQLEAGQVMASYALAEVMDPNGSDLTVGTLVQCDTGWQEYAAVTRSECTPVSAPAVLTHAISVLGVSGMAAYFGLADIGRPLAGETVVVSAAAGATGHIAGQIARIGGSRVVGVTGSDTKKALLVERLGFDATVNHRSPTFDADLRAAAPRGVDVYFDNVGGQVLESVLRRMNTGGRVVCCGSVTHYEPRPDNRMAQLIPGLLVSRRIRMQGFIVLDEAERWPAAAAQLTAWIDEGTLQPLESVHDGLDSAPDALIGLLSGDNTGKRLVRVADRSPVPAS